MIVMALANPLSAAYRANVIEDEAAWYKPSLVPSVPLRSRWICAKLRWHLCDRCDFKSSSVCSINSLET